MSQLWRVVPYPKPRGTYPVVDFIKKLKMDEQIKILAIINTFLKKLDPVHDLERPLVGVLAPNLWELRPGKFRFPFTLCKEWGIILVTHGFRKKTQKTPPEEISMAQRYSADFRNRYGRGEINLEGINLWNQ